MHFLIIFAFIAIRGSLCDWVSEWLTPLEYQYKDILTQNAKNHTNLKLLSEDENSEVIPINRYLLSHDNYNTKNSILNTSRENLASKSLILKLEETLKTAAALTSTLKREIKEIEIQEGLLKEAIANGRSGVTTVTVSTLAQAPRIYIIRDGFWSLCDGIIHHPAAYTTFTELFSVPRCIGQEVTSKRDPCVFNSVIKYEVIPQTRRSTYYEDDYLCLKPSFNNSLENFMSVTKKVVDETCTNGVIRSVTDNVQDCGVRVLSEYTYYPNKDETTSILPLEYCTGRNGSCKLVVAWHVTNKTVENFEFLDSDPNFKKFFIKSDMEAFI